MYELWNTESRNAIDSFETRESALGAVHSLITRDGYRPESLYLAQVGLDGSSTAVATGDDLATQALTQVSEAATR